MTHSPAPWRWKTVEGYGSSWLYDDDGNQIWHSITTPSKPDAALIAAAPEMLEVLKGLAAAGSDIAPFWEKAIIRVVAKAEGNVLSESPTE